MIENESGEVRQRLLMLQVIYAALIAGAAMFAGIAMLVSMAMVEQAPEDPAAAPLDVEILRFVWIGVAVMSIIGVVVVRKKLPQMAAAQFKDSEPSPATLFGPYFMMTIITGAVLEGVSIFGSVILLLGDNPLDLALGLLPLAVMIPFFPSARGFEAFGRQMTGEDPAGGLAPPARDQRRYR